MEDKRIIKMYLMGNRTVRDQYEKASAKWEDVDRTDVLQSAGMRDWKRRAGDTEEWRCLLREVRPYMDGCKCYSGHRQPGLVNTAVSILSFSMNITHFADS